MCKGIVTFVSPFFCPTGPRRSYLTPPLGTTLFILVPLIARVTLYLSLSSQANFLCLSLSLFLAFFSLSHNLSTSLPHSRPLNILPKLSAIKPLQEDFVKFVCVSIHLPPPSPNSQTNPPSSTSPHPSSLTTPHHLHSHHSLMAPMNILLNLLAWKIVCMDLVRGLKTGR